MKHIRSSFLGAVLLVTTLAFVAPVAHAAEKYDKKKLLQNFAVAGSATISVTTNAITTVAGNPPAWFFLYPNRDVCLQINLVGTNAGSGNINLTIAQSVDGISFGTVQPKVIGIAKNGTSPVCLVTNIAYTNFGGAHFGAVYQIQNADAAGISISVTSGSYDANSPQ